MTTRTHTARAIEVPDLVGDKADQAIGRLRELGLMPITWSAEVDDVNRAGFVLGLDPPAGTTVRPKASITMSVAAHPDFQGHADDAAASEAQPLVQPPLTWPLSGPTGFAASAPASPFDALTDAFTTAATPDVPSAPASSPIDAASRETRLDDAAASSAVQAAPGVAANPYLQDVSTHVPTPDEISAAAEWDRLRAAEAARHTAPHPSSDVPEPAPSPDAPIGDATQEPAPRESPAELEDQARREAKKRRARQRRHLTLKQKAIVATVLAVTVLIGVAAMSAHRPAARATAAAHPALRQSKRPGHDASTHTAAHHKRPTAGSGTAHHKRAKTSHAPAHHKRAQSRRRVSRVHWRTRTRVTTVTVPTTAPSTPSTSSSLPSTPSSSGASTTAPASTGAGSPTTSAPPAGTPTTSHQPTSTPSASGSGSSGTNGGTPLTSPDGTTAPPKP